MTLDAAESVRNETHARALLDHAREHAMPADLRDAVADAALDGARMMSGGPAPFHRSPHTRDLVVVARRGTRAADALARVAMRRTGTCSYYDPAWPGAEWLGFWFWW